MMALMGKFFDTSKFDSQEGALAFCIESTSPAWKVIKRYFALLDAPEHPLWLLVRGPGEWSQHRLQLASTVFIFVVASCFYRLVMPCNTWPWLLAKAVSPQVERAERERVANLFMQCEGKCCLEPGLSRQVRAIVTSADDLLNDTHVSRLISHTFRATPVSNIPCEDRFARQSAQHFACHGRVPFFSTLAARHVLCETQAWHHIAMDKRAADFQSEQQDVSPDHMAHRSGWHAFVSQNRTSADLASLGIRWQQMSSEEKQAYYKEAEESKLRQPATTGNKSIA